MACTAAMAVAREAAELAILLQIRGPPLYKVLLRVLLRHVNIEKSITASKKCHHIKLFHSHELNLAVRKQCRG